MSCRDANGKFIPIAACTGLGPGESRNRDPRTGRYVPGKILHANQTPPAPRKIDEGPQPLNPSGTVDDLVLPPTPTEPDDIPSPADADAIRRAREAARRIAERAELEELMTRRQEAGSARYLNKTDRQRLLTLANKQLQNIRANAPKYPLSHTLANAAKQVAPSVGAAVGGLGIALVGHEIDQSIPPDIRNDSQTIGGFINNVTTFMAGPEHYDDIRKARAEQRRQLAPPPEPRVLTPYEQIDRTLDLLGQPNPFAPDPVVSATPWADLRRQAAAQQGQLIRDWQRGAKK